MLRLSFLREDKKMFGYFRFNQMFASPKIKRVYKNYYCGTCFALEYNYGEITRIILSYDAVILALTARLYKNPVRDTLPCFFKKNEKQQFYQVESWEKLAAINVLLMKAKLSDDINDEKSSKAKAATIIFSRTIKKAENDFPALASIIDKGYSRMYELEGAGSPVMEICNAFSDMMGKLMVKAFNINHEKERFIKAIAKWLYFIDQLDDYDEDVKEGKYNPLVENSISKTDLINKEHNVLFEYLKELFAEFENIKQTMDLANSEDRLLYAVLNESIPVVTTSVLTGRDLPQIAHRKKELEWNE